MTKKNQTHKEEQNRDPITDEPGAHPVGTGVGAVVGGAAGGAALGAATSAVEGAIYGTAVGGPIGTAVGAVAGVVAGAVVGGLAGKSIAESVDPTREDAYWRSSFKDRPYVEKDASYDDYGPAYRYGVDARTRYPDRNYDDVSSEMERGWQNARGQSQLEWQKAREAARDAWDRVNMPQTQPQSTHQRSGQQK